VPGRTLAIGDIHGCQLALRKLLEQIQPTAEDNVVLLGDVVDRGPATREVIEQILDLQNKCRLIFIMGNHEEMMLSALAGGEWANSWPSYGGIATVASYGGDEKQIPAEHLEFLRTGLDYWENESAVFVHANLEPRVPLEQQHPEWLRWTHLSGFERPLPSGKQVICGHTPQKSGNPLVLSDWVCIDTFACGGGWLTCLDPATDEFIQTNQLGELRTGKLP
jgi:serine/threonine protein phosphatase 1